MSRKPKPCIECGELTFSQKEEPRCRTHAMRLRIKRTGTVEEYRREHHLKKKYGMTAVDFQNEWDACNGLCSICETQMIMPEYSRGQKLHAACVDHDHDSGKFRGLLCNACNKAIGLLQDNPDVISKAWRYLSGKKDGKYSCYCGC